MVYISYEKNENSKQEKQRKKMKRTNDKQVLEAYTNAGRSGWPDRSLLPLCYHGEARITTTMVIPRRQSLGQDPPARICMNGSCRG